jgi:hypothetical protein
LPDVNTTDNLSTNHKQYYMTAPSLNHTTTTTTTNHNHNNNNKKNTNHFTSATTITEKKRNDGPKRFHPSFIKSSSTTAFVDTAATDTLVRESDSFHIVKNSKSVQPHKSLSIGLPNGNTIRSKAVGHIDKFHHSPPMLQDTTTSAVVKIPAHIFSDDQLNHTLFSVADYCNQGCTAVFTKTGFEIASYDGTVILNGHKHPQAKLWPVDIDTFTDTTNLVGKEMSVTNSSASQVVRHQIDAEFVSYCHSSLGSPTIPTFLQALRRGYLSTWPKLNARIVAANIPVSVATAKGHLDLSRQGIQSTTKVLQSDNNYAAPTIKIEHSDNDNHDDNNNIIPTEFQLDNDVYYDDPTVFTKIVFLTDKTLYVDLTGRFPIQSYRGNNYVLVSVFNNYIKAVPMRNREAGSYVEAHRSIREHFQLLGIAPTILRLDNESSNQLSTYLQSEGISMQFVPPNNHRANKAERAIRDFKNHFVSTLASVHPSFPMGLWDELIPQVELTLNSMRPFSAQPEFSAYNAIHGHKYDFSAHPIAPCGTYVLIHNSSQTRSSWAPHGEPGFYLGPALKHYRCYRAYCSKTKAIRVTDTLAWFPEALHLPGSSKEELLLAAIQDFTAALQCLQNSVNWEYGSDKQHQWFDTTKSAISVLSQLVEMYAGGGDLNKIDNQSKIPDPKVDASNKELLPATLLPPLPPLIDNEGIPIIRNDDEIQGVNRQREKLIPSNDDSMIVDTASIQRQQQQRYSLRSKSVQDEEERTFPGVPPSSSPSLNHEHLAQPTRKSNRRTRHKPQHLLDDRWVYMTRGLHYKEAFQGINEPKAVSCSDEEKFFEAARAFATRALNLDEDGKPLTFSSAIRGPDAALWTTATAEEFRRLLDSATLKPIYKADQPFNRRRDTTYYNQVVAEKLNVDGSIKRRVRGTAGGEKTNYPFDVSAKTAEMEMFKTLIQAAVSERRNSHCQRGKFMTLDIKDFYLGASLDGRPEFIRIPIKYIPESILTAYNLTKFITNGSILFQIDKCMYGLPQAGLISQKKLFQHLEKNGYIQDTNVPCLFRHKTLDVTFILVVDDFGVKYSNSKDVNNLISVLEELYELKIDWDGNKYLGFDIRFDDTNHTVSVSMPGYVDKLLQRFNSAGLILRGAASPAVYLPPAYGIKVQKVDEIDVSDVLNKDEIKLLQEIIGTLLFYARAVDYTMLTAVNHVSSLQSKPTKDVLKRAIRILQYAASYPNHHLVFKACDMVLHVHSDASYLTRPNARSVAGGIFYCADHLSTTSHQTNLSSADDRNINGGLLAVSTIIPTVCSSAAEAEYAALFINGIHGTWLRTVLAALGYPQQQPTTIYCDNECAVGIATRSVKTRRSKAIDMRYHWIRDRVENNVLQVRWIAGIENYADFFTKALPVHQHQKVKGLYVSFPPNPLNPFLGSIARHKQKRRMKLMRSRRQQIEVTPSNSFRGCVGDG